MNPYHKLHHEDLGASRALGMVDEATFARGKTLLHRIVSMLVKMAM